MVVVPLLRGPVAWLISIGNARALLGVRAASLAAYCGAEPACASASLMMLLVGGGYGPICTRWHKGFFFGEGI